MSVETTLASIRGDLKNVTFEVHTDDGMVVSVDWGEATIATPPVSGKGSGGVDAMLSGLREAIGVWYNVSGELQCFDIGGEAAGTSTPSEPADAEKEAIKHLRLEMESRADPEAFDDDVRKGRICTQIPSWRQCSWGEVLAATKTSIW